jgi:hypothetical protein
MTTRRNADIQRRREYRGAYDRGTRGGLLLGGLGRNPPEIAYWERGQWWLAGDARPWHPDAVSVASDRLVFRPQLMPIA